MEWAANGHDSSNDLEFSEKNGPSDCYNRRLSKRAGRLQNSDQSTEMAPVALFFGPCPVCGDEMGEDDGRAMTHFLGPEGNRLRYSDVVMHWDCYALWEHRPRFAQLYFKDKREWIARNPFRDIVHADEKVFVTVDPSEFVGEIDVTLAETGSGFRIRLRDWEFWLGGNCFKCCHHEIERKALAAILPLLRFRFPTPNDVIGAAEQDRMGQP